MCGLILKRACHAYIALFQAGRLLGVLNEAMHDWKGPRLNLPKDLRLYKGWSPSVWVLGNFLPGNFLQPRLEFQSVGGWRERSHCNLACWPCS